MNPLDSLLNPPHDRCIVTTRFVAAPVTAVFRAWTDPALLQLWWGPEGFTNTIHEFDLRPEGRWRFTMHGPDGKDYPNESVFLKVQAPDLVVWEHVSGHRFHVVAQLEATGEGTWIRFNMVFPTAEDCAEISGFILPRNAENMDRLERVLAEMNP